MNYLDGFCEASGQKASMAKFLLFCSNNVNNDLANQHGKQFRFIRTNDLGMYLGVPLHQKRVTIHTYDHLVEDIRQKINGWQSRYLSPA